MRKNFTGRNMSFIAVGMGAGVVAGHWSMTTGSSMGGSGEGGTTLGRNRSRKSSSSFSSSSSLAPVKSIVYKTKEISFEIKFCVLNLKRNLAFCITKYLFT